MHSIIKAYGEARIGYADAMSFFVMCERFGHITSRTLTKRKAELKRVQEELRAEWLAEHRPNPIRIPVGVRSR
jgi:hypothetical protein